MTYVLPTDTLIIDGRVVATPQSILYCETNIVTATIQLSPHVAFELCMAMTHDCMNIQTATDMTKFGEINYDVLAVYCPYLARYHSVYQPSQLYAQLWKTKLQSNCNVESIIECRVQSTLRPTIQSPGMYCTIVPLV